MHHKHTRQQVIEYLRKHPGISAERVSRSFGCRMDGLLRLMRDQGQVFAIATRPYFTKAIKNAYFVKEG